MERGSMVRWLLIGLAIFLFIQFGKPLLFGDDVAVRQPLDVADTLAPPAAMRAEEQLCMLKGARFEAEASTKGGSLRHVRLLDDKYKNAETGKPIDLVSTWAEGRSPLRTDLRLPGAETQQVAYDDVDWKLASSDDARCTFTYTDDKDEKGEPKTPTVALTKTIATTGRPFELSVDVEVKNLATEARKHRFTIEQTDYRTEKETESHLGRLSDWATEVVTKTTEGVERFVQTDFEPKSFEKPEFTPERWRRSPGEARWVATSSSYFTKTVIHDAGPATPVGETQVEEVWDARIADKKNDPTYGHVFRSRLAYPEQELAPGATAQYRSFAFAGPKERGLLAAVAAGAHPISETINLGWFSFIGEYLIAYVYLLQGLVGSWGWAIVLLTITVKLLLFPLSLSQIKSSIAMRRLKPEMDEINKKYKDDMTQRGLATQELWRKNKVSSPIVGCIPMLFQMPVWFALYTALQTAVELFHTPFGPFIPDLSTPGQYYIIPIVLGASSFLQQRIMPPQGDPQQQKMMLYLMPGIFTVMMLFLPAGLGVYMLTNTWLGIGQQMLVERYLKSRSQDPQGPNDITVREKTPTEPAKATASLGKGKARVHG